MMNFVALFLVVSSLVSAGMWSPSPADNQNHKQKQGEHHHREVIVKNGHRVVVVEYDEHGHPNTKVSISPEQQDHHHQAHKDSSSISNNDVSTPARVSRSFDNAVENIKEASSSVLPNFGEGHRPKELICDACGKCKETVANVIETKKEIMKETAHAAKEAAVKVGEVAGKAKDKAEEVYEKAKKVASDTAREVEETAKESVGKAKSAAETAKATGDTLLGDIKRNVTGKAKEAKETAEQSAEKVKAGAEELKSGTLKRFHQLGHRAKEIWNNAFGSSGVMDGLMSVVQLFGLATAYGMSMWITFVSSHLLSENLAPQQFGMVQSKIYKVYFRVMAYSVGTALLGQLWRQRNNTFSGNAAHVLQNYNLLAGLLGILVNMLFLEPRSTKVMLERMKMEKDEGRGRGGGQVGTRITREAGQEPTRTEAEPSTITPSQVPERREQEGAQSDVARLDEMRQRLKNLNMYSSFLNIMSLMGLSWHLVYLALRLHGSCC